MVPGWHFVPCYSSSTVINIFWMNKNLTQQIHMRLRHWKYYLRKPPPLSKFTKHSPSFWWPKFILVTWRGEPDFQSKWKPGLLLGYQPSNPIVRVHAIPPVPRWKGLVSRTVTWSFRARSYPSHCCPPRRRPKAKPTARLTRPPMGSWANVQAWNDDKQAGAPLRPTQNTLQRQTQRRNNNLKEKAAFQFPDNL